ncbi:hypothetical protein PMG11_06316 [Penicillium brasilianum]|uniref:DUF3533 domain-containing protein n=1 Tax=Penicillium brasilianum TaxID=104259 RepID=A0A0F7TQA7_PENBI|nr:hypothetical protein PMG11_06316 [Penicillium brasilianum]
MGFYSKARLPRPSIHDPSVKLRRLALLKAATINLLVLQFLFLGLFCYIFGSLFQQNTHIHNINVLFVDYDGGAIGTAVRDAYQELEGPSFPTLDQRPTLVYPEPDSIEEAVCNIKFWGALYITANSSNDLTAALAGGSAASLYNTSNVLTLIWNEARYPTTVDSAIYDKLITLSEAARVAYMKNNAKQTIQSVNSSDDTALSVFSNPWTLSSVNLKPTSQGSRLIYNTLVIILIMIQEFFYLGYVNGLYQQFNLYLSIKPRRIAIVRQIISGVYTFIGSLCTAGAIWAFRNNWNVNGGQFMLTWMALWLFAHLNFLVLDVVTVWVSPPFVPMVFISWIVLNVTSILLPFELSPAFYKIGYAFPAHSIFNVLIDIWSAGCNPQLYYGLPVLFAYEICGLVLSSVGVYRRSHYAVIKQEKDEKDLHDRVMAAIAEQQDQQLAREETLEYPESRATDSEREEGARERRGTVTTMLDRGDVMDVIRREMSRPRDETSSSRANNGPCFDLPYSE